MTELRGTDLTVTLENGQDEGAPYVNSIGSANLTFLGDDLDAGWTQASEPADAIGETGGTIAVYIGDGNPNHLLTVTLDGPNDYSGGTFLNESVLIADDATALGNNELVIDGEAAFEAGVSLTLNLLSINADVALGAASGAVLTISGTVLDDNGAGSSLIFGFYDEVIGIGNSVTTTGVIDLDPSSVGATGTSGVTSVVSGTLVIGNANAANLIDSRQDGLSVGTSSGSYAALDLNGNNLTAYNLTGYLSASIHNNGLNAAVLTVDETKDSAFKGSIQDGLSAISVVVDANGSTFTLNGASNSYSGGTTINSGVLNIQTGDDLGSGGITFDGSSGATLVASNGFNLATAITVDANTSAYIQEADDNAALSLDAPGANGFSVGADAALHFGGAGAKGAIYLDLATAQTVGDGATLDVDGGFLLPQDAAGAAFIGQFASVAIGTDLATFAVIDLNGFDLTLNDLSGDARGNIQNDASAAVTLTLDNSLNTTFDGNIHGSPHGQSYGALSVVIEGTGTLTFTDDETYIGGTTIDSGATLALSDDTVGHSGTLLGNVVDNGTLMFDASSSTHAVFQGNITGSGKIVIGKSAITQLDGDNSFSGGAFLGGDALLDIGAADAIGGGIVTFQGRAAELRFEQHALSVAKIAGFIEGDCIDLVGVAADSAVATAGKLTVLAGQMKVAQFKLAGAPSTLNLSTLRTASGTLIYVDVKLSDYAGLKPKLDIATDGFALIGSATNLSAEYTQFGSDQQIALIVVSNAAAVALTTEEAFSVFSRLRNADGSKGAVAIVDTAADVSHSLDALETKVARIVSIAFDDANLAPVLFMTKAQKIADAPLLQKIVGDWIAEIQNTDNSYIEIGHGDGLTISAIPGVDTITGGGMGDTFDLAAGFGSATITDLNTHLTGIGHDFIDLSSSEFVNFHALYNHTTVQGSNLVIASGGDTLTLDNMTLSGLKSIAAHFHFL